MSSSSPPRDNTRRDTRSEIHSSSSALFVGSSRPELTGYSRNVSRRGDIHSDTFGTTPSARRRVFVNANGMPVNDDNTHSDATFSNLNPGTSDADALGGTSTRLIWGTNISIQDTVSTFKNFIYNYARKYRMWADGATEAETRAMGDAAEEKEYVTILNNMRKLGVTGLNLDTKNLKAYPSTQKLWHQLHAYPQEIIPIMDHTIKDILLEMAEREMEALKIQARQNRARIRDSSAAPPPSSDAMNETGQAAPDNTPNLVEQVESNNYKVLPFGLDKSVNMRELDPAGEKPFGHDLRYMRLIIELLYRHGQTH